MTNPTLFLGPGDLRSAEGVGQLRTLLGTCVSVCVWHPSKYGIMCHFLLPMQPDFMQQKFGPQNRYGNVALNEMLRMLRLRGIDKSACQWWVFGGSSKTLMPTQIGVQNFDYARDFLSQHHIKAMMNPAAGPMTVILDVKTGKCVLKHNQE